MASTKAVALAMAIVILASALVSVGSSVPVAADLGDGHTTTVPELEFDPSERPPGRITRNLVKGESLTVCSTDFPEATKTAIDRWNDALSHEVLTFEADSTKCQSASSSATWNPEKGVVAVFVSVGTVANNDRIQGSVLPADRKYTCPSTAAACVRQDDVGKGDVWRTRFGRLEVIVNPGRYRNWPDGRLEYLITHELGHALSLGDYFCNYRDDDGNPHPDFIDELTIMNTRSFWPDQQSQACNPPGGIPADRDVEDYEEVYTPAAVTDFSGTAQRQTVILTWDQSEVFVESEFEIQRASGAAWVDEATAEVNAMSATLTNQPGGVQRYRIVARTMALPEEEDGHGHAHGTPSAVVEVPVQLSVPTNARAAIRTPSSLSLTWDTVNGADRYELRRTTPSADCEGAVQATVTKPPHLFRNLTADTDYRLCVRAKLSTNSAVTSAWADEEAATLPVPNLIVNVSPRSASCYTGGSVSIRWTISNGTAPYAVKVNGVSASGTRKTVTCRSTAGTQTVSVTATDASTPPRSGSASVSLTVTNPPAPPPPEPTLTISASASPTSCTAGGTVNVRWSVSGASGSYTVTVGGRSVSTSPTSVTCRSTAGRQSITVRVEDSRGHSASRTLYVIVTTPPMPPRPIDCLSSTAAGNFATYGNVRSGCPSVPVPSLLAAVRQVSSAVCAIRLWQIGEDGVGKWVQYGLSGGRVIPGSISFQIGVGATLWLSTCTSGSGGVSGASGLEAPSCPDAVKPESGPAVIDADASSCTTVRGGGAVQISRGEYTLNVSLASDRDWFASAPSSYTGSSAGAFLFLDLTTGGWIALYPPDGFELERHTPADATGLPALLDAIAASAAPSVYPAPDP